MFSPNDNSKSQNEIQTHNLLPCIILYLSYRISQKTGELILKTLSYAFFRIIQTFK